MSEATIRTWMDYGVEQKQRAEAAESALAAKDTALSERDATIARQGASIMEWGALAQKNASDAVMWQGRATAAEAELERAHAEIKRLKTPDTYWEWTAPECGYSDISEALSDVPMGGVVRLMAGKTLDDIWATTRVLTVDDGGEWDDHEIACFDNVSDAERCWPESLAAARTLSEGQS